MLVLGPAGPSTNTRATPLKKAAHLRHLSGIAFATITCCPCVGRVLCVPNGGATPEAAGGGRREARQFIKNVAVWGNVSAGGIGYLHSSQPHVEARQIANRSAGG